jgi:hypothetical protein
MTTIAPPTSTTTTSATLEQLTQIGGKLWEKNGARRVYFNYLSDLFSLATVLFGTGNIRHAWLDGEEISNCYARKIVGDLGAMKLWVDLTDGSIHTRVEYRQVLDYNYERRIVRGLLDSIATLRTHHVREHEVSHESLAIAWLHSARAPTALLAITTH